METLSPVVPLVATVTRVASNSRGNIKLTNNGDPLSIAGYSIVSEGGALSPANWKAIADLYDASGNDSVDNNDEWIKLSTGSSRYDLSEFEPDGDGGVVNTGQTIDFGNVWIQNTKDDITMELLLTDGSILPVSILYDGASAFQFGDLDFDGDFDVQDFTGKFVAGFGASTAGLSPAERYQSGDFNNDNVVDELDFLLYNKAYLTTNPGAASLSFATVPEPSSLALWSLACIAASLGWRRRKAVVLFAAALVMVGVAADPIRAASPIAHWKFDEPIGATTLNDSIGMNNSTSIGSALPGAVGRIGGAWNFNDLPGITINPSSGSLTGLGYNYSISGWVKTTDELGVILGISDNSQPSEEVTLRVSTGSDPNGAVGLLSRPAIDGPGNEALSTTLVNDNTWRHVVFTSNDSGWRMYVDGALENSGSSPASPAAIGANSVNIGMNEHDTGFEWGLSGALDDLVVWDAQLSDIEIANMYVKGLYGRGATEAFNDALALQVDRSTGSVTFKNEGGSNFEIDLYRIVSPDGSLVASNWSSFDDLGLDSAAWTELGGTSGKVSEGAFGSSTMFTSGFSQFLGNLYNTSIDAEDLMLEYHLVGTPAGLLVRGKVNYELGELSGDYNGDGTVDAADYIVWRKTFGQSGAGLPADGNSNGAIDHGDYSVWQSNFGKSGGSGSAAPSVGTSVPEPATIWMCACIAVACQLARTRRSLRGATVLGLLLCVSTANADVHNDRNYRLGDDSDENGSIGATIGATTGGVTYDSAGSLGSGNLQDLVVHGNPTYADASDRPGAIGLNRGASFDGDGDSLSTPISLNAPAQMWDNIDFFPLTPFPFNYEKIFAHGIQLWAKPSSEKQGVRQALITDTTQHGIYIGGTNTWGLLHGGASINSGVPVSFDEWTHVMQLSGFSDPRRGFSATGGALYVNGVAVATRAAGYNADNTTSLSLGSNQDQSGNFYQGVLDGVRLFLWGDNTGENSGDGRLGQYWGTLDLGVDNDWIAQKLSSLGVTDPADVNLDGFVLGDGSGSPTTDDVSAFVSNWRSQRLVDGVQVGDWISRQNGDLNYDGIVDLRDAWILHNGLINSGSGSGLNFNLLNTTVPEPAGAMLFIAGVFVLCARLRFRLK